MQEVCKHLELKLINGYVGVTVMVAPVYVR